MWMEIKSNKDTISLLSEAVYTNKKTDRCPHTHTHVYTAQEERKGDSRKGESHC